MNYCSPHIVRSDQLTEGITTAEIGGKAYQLWRVSRADVHIPSWLVITSHEMQRWLDPYRTDVQRLLSEVRDAASARIAANRIAQLLEPAELDECFLRQLTLATYRQFGICARVAVRSSAVDEDGASHSFAGQFDSFLQVPTEQIPGMVLKVWRSAFSERVLAYRAAKGLQLDKIGMAVIVQEMVPAAAAGVMFTTAGEGDSPAVLIEAAYGLGEGVVANHADTDTYRCSKHGWHVSRVVRPKHRQVIAGTDSHHPTERTAVPAEQVNRPVLTRSQIQRLRRTANRVEQHFGKPQDVEWAFDASGDLYILQTRPITAGSESVSASSQIFDNANIVESYPGLTLPLSFSFILRNYETLFQAASCGLILSKKRLMRRQDIWKHMVGLIHGRVYYNLSNWYAMLAYLPGFEHHKVAWDNMIGISRATVVAPARLPWYDRAYATMQIAWRLLAVRRIERQFFLRFNPLYAKYRRRDVSHMSPQELEALYQQMASEFTRFWHVTLYTDFCAMKYYDWLARLCRRWTDGTVTNLHSDLLCGQAGMESVGPIRSVVAMAEQIRANPMYRSLFHEYSDEEIWQIVTTESGYLPLLEECRAHLDLFGDRCAEELKLETVTPREKPALLIATLRSYVKTEITVASLAAREIEKLVEAERRLETWVTNPFKQIVIQVVLERARAAVSGRENMRFARTRLYGLVRAIFRRYGTLMAEQGIIESADDIGFLTIDEVFAQTGAAGMAIDLKHIIERRKNQYAGYATETLPSRLESCEPQATRAGQAEGTHGGQMRLVGTGCSSGVVEGGAAVVASVAEARFTGEQILVAESTDPSWVFLMVQARGLIVERGSILSHTAIIGRELGIPTIVGVPNATRVIPNGCHLRINGATGEVVW